MWFRLCFVLHKKGISQIYRYDTEAVPAVGKAGSFALKGAQYDVFLQTRAGHSAAVTATPSDTGVALDFVLPQGPTGPTGSTGVKGDIGATGPAPTITVEESTPATYRVRFHSSGVT